MLIIRRPTVKDSDGIKAIFFEKQLGDFFKTMPPGLIEIAGGPGMENIMEAMSGFNHDAALDEYVDDFLSVQNRCAIMDKDGMIIGYCLASADMVNDFGTMKLIIGIGDVYIKEGYRRKGYGTRLVKSFVNLMNKKEECSIVTALDETQYTPVNAKLFENNGFILEKLRYKLELGKKKYVVDHVIRNAVPGDYKGYSDLVIYMYESFKGFDENIYSGTDVVYSKQYYLAQLSDPCCHHFVCEIGKDIAGICVVQTDGDEVSIHTVSVAKKHAKKGIATSLYNNAFNFAKGRGFHEISAVVFAQNKASRKFHEHMMMQPVTHRYKYMRLT